MNTCNGLCFLFFPNLLRRPGCADGCADSIGLVYVKINTWMLFIFFKEKTHVRILCRLLKT